MRKFFVFFYHPCYFQAGKVLVSALTTPIQPQRMQPQLVWGEKTHQLVSQYLHNTRKLYPLMVEKGLGGIVSPPSPP